MNEEFVPFALAKKLQEKGCSVKCLAIYTNVGVLHCNESLGPHETCMDLLEMNNNERSRGFIYDAPTISQVLKWLREEKKIHVIIATFIDQLNRCHTWGYEIWNISSFPKHIQHVSAKTNFTGHDKAAIAGIEYCLDDLI